MNAVWSSPAYEQVALVIRSEAGLIFPPARRPEVEAAVRRVMGALGLKRISEFVDGLSQRHLALDDLIDELTVGETYFFRDSSQMEFIRREVLPDFRRRYRDGHCPRIWSAGCASGEEPFSLAILLEQEGLIDGVTILGTDISRTALARARSATYGPRSFREQSGDLAGRYFETRGHRMVLAERLRRRVTFEHVNLALDAYPSLHNGTWGCDLILCRNVLIYFDRDTVTDVARRLFAALGKGGWLVCGASDPSLSDLAPFETVVTAAGVFYRRPSDDLPSRPRFVPMPATAPRPAAIPVPTPTRARALQPAARPEPPRTPPRDLLAEARKAYTAADYGRVLELTGGPSSNEENDVLRIRALSNLGETAAAEKAATEALSRHPVSAELHFLRSVLLLAAGRLRDAGDMVRRALYLDRSLVVGHLVLGTILARMGERTEASRAYRNAYGLASSLPPDELVPLGDGERAERLAESAKTRIASLVQSGGCDL